MIGSKDVRMHITVLTKELGISQVHVVTKSLVRYFDLGILIDAVVEYCLSSLCGWQKLHILSMLKLGLLILCRQKLKFESNAKCYRNSSLTSSVC